MIRNYDKIISPEVFAQFVDRLLAAGSPVGFDIETGYRGDPVPGASLHPEQGMIVGFSFTNSPQWARYVPLVHDNGPNMDPAQAAPLLWRLLSSGLAVAHNNKFEARWTSAFFREHLSDHPEYGAAVAQLRGYVPWFSDTLLESYVEASQPSHGLKALTKSMFGHDQADLLSLFPDLPKSKAKTLRFNELELTPAVISYACEDAVWCLAIHEQVYPLVSDSMIYKTEMAITPILCAMEDEGVVFDWQAMLRSADEAEAFMAVMDAAIQAELTRLIGSEVSINLGSPVQVAKVLYERLGLPVKNTTKTGNPSTDAATLGMLAAQYPVVQQMLDWKEIKTLITRYLRKFPNEFNYAPDGRAHANHLQAYVPSGRFAVSDPPLQQLPKMYRYEIDDVNNERQVFECAFRDFVQAPPGWRIVGFDYSQVELRVLAAMSGEPALLDAFTKGHDVHQTTASLIFGVPVDQVTKEQRQQAKGINFSLLYGAGAKNLSEQLRIPKTQAQDLIDTYFRIYSSVQSWKDTMIATGQAQGYVSTHFGRKIVIREFESTDSWIYAKGERLCINGPVQGTAADYMKIAMVRADKALTAAGLDDRVRLVMNIHDALEYYVHESVDTAEVIAVLDPAVSFPVPGFPPIIAEWHEGLTWGSVQDVDITALRSPASGQQEQEGPLTVAVQDSQALSPDPGVVGRAEGSELQNRVIGPSTVYVDLDQPPFEREYRAFLGWLRDHPGHSAVVVRVAGEQVTAGVSSLSVSDSAEIGTILTGARVVLGEDSVDVSALAEGLDDA